MLEDNEELIVGRLSELTARSALLDEFQDQFRSDGSAEMIKNQKYIKNLQMNIQKCEVKIQTLESKLYHAK